MSKVLTVFGATGQQGGSLINHILQNPELSTQYYIRGITRNASKPAALALQARGVQIVEADLDKPSTLTTAIAGSYAVFGVTNFWEHASASIEIAQGKAIADASVTANVTLLIWSSLPSVSKMSHGRVTTIKHFDSKATVESYIRELPGPTLKVFFMAGWYMQNHLHYMPPVPKGDNTYIFQQTWSSNAQVPMIDITDTGKYLSPILLDPHKYNNATLTCATAFYTPLQLVDGWTKVTGKKVVYEQVDAGAAQGNLTEEMKSELRGSVGLIDEYSYFGPRGKEGMEWTLKQMKGGDEPTSWENFVLRSGPWFGE